MGAGKVAWAVWLGGVFISLVVLDALDYWWHRWNHRVPLLGIHKAHHADNEIDVSTALRFHPGELSFWRHEGHLDRAVGTLSGGLVCIRSGGELIGAVASREYRFA